MALIIITEAGDEEDFNLVEGPNPSRPVSFPGRRMENELFARGATQASFSIRVGADNGPARWVKNVRGFFSLTPTIGEQTELSFVANPGLANDVYH